MELVGRDKQRKGKNGQTRAEINEIEMTVVSNDRKKKGQLERGEKEILRQ